MDEHMPRLLNVDEIENPIVGARPFDVLVIVPKDTPRYHWRGADNVSLCAEQWRGNLMQWEEAEAAGKKLCRLCSDVVERMKEGW
jgi:hypothetical protein